MPQLNENTKYRITIIAGWVNKFFAYKFLKKLPFNAKALIIVLACSFLVGFSSFVVIEIITWIIRVIFHCYSFFCETFLVGMNQFIVVRGKRALFVYASVGLIVYYAVTPYLLRAIYFLIKSVKQFLFCEDAKL